MLLAAFLVATQDQPVGVWEKLVAPGVTYRMEVAPGPVLINAVRITPDADGVLMVGELADGVVFDPDGPTKGRETVSATALRTNALVTVNADFFPFTGDPLGAMVRDGELLSSPQSGRAAFCWGKGFAQAAYLSFGGHFAFEGQVFAINGVNQECVNDMVVLNSPSAGFATSRERTTHAVCEMAGKLSPSGKWEARVKRVIENATIVPVGDGEVVLSYHGVPAEKLTFLNAGDLLEISIECKGSDWKNATNVVAGGPFLVRGGKAFIPYAAEGFTDGFAKNRHPRTAIGKTKAGDVWIVTVDGRQAVSVGATLAELADVMLRLGCADAINLDGGGSTTINLSTVTVNRPSEGTERPVANSIVVFSSSVVPVAFPVGEPGPVVAGPAELKSGETASYRVVDASGESVPQCEVLWSAQGAAWIDQSGTLRGSGEGACRILAFARGKTANLTVNVVKG